MRVGMTNYFPFTCQSMAVSSSEPITSFSPAGTPSPPAIGYHHLPADLMLNSRRPAHLPAVIYPHQQTLNNTNFYFQDINVSRPKVGFTIKDLLGLNEDKRDFVGVIRYDGCRERVRHSPYDSVPSATPRSALTALLPPSPDTSPKKDESKCRSHHLSNTNDDSDDVESKYSILHQNSKTTCSGGHKSPPHSGGKMKRIRTIFTPEQLERLESEFERQQYMVGPERQYLASTLHLSESQVKIWFQNRRIKWRKQHVEMQQARLAQINKSDSSLRESDVAESESDADQGNLQDSSLQSSWEDFSVDRI